MTEDPVTLQIISSSLLYASEEMGLALRNSAYSPNIKERMDHSAAVFDPAGRLLAQAEHIPVHLGSLPWGLQNLIRHCERDGIAFDEGSMVAANNPYITGTHLNDMTVAAPVHHRGELVAFVVNKAHHSDVGGIVPGSISMSARTLGEEGFVLEPSLLWKRKEFVGPLVERFASASRTPAERKGDLKAQVAANVTGVRRVLDLVQKYGAGAFAEAALHSSRRSESLSRERIAKFTPGTYQATDFLEGPRREDLKLSAKVSVNSRGVDVDFAGTSKEVDYPLNAVFGVTLSGVYFVLRCLLGDDIQANYGAFAPVAVKAPKGTILNPTYPHPVGGGNVETSQRNADVIFHALSSAVAGRVPAAAGGSMNNVMIGGRARKRTWAFYETIGVGLGGGSGWDGIDGIQANMTNTMNTPIEEVERILPIRMVRYEFRSDSAGAGKFRGGCGLIRGYQVLSDGTTFTTLADRARHRPWGLEGGGRGAGTEVLVKRRGETRRVFPKSTLSLTIGDVVEIRTAGGGGYGSATNRRERMIRRDVANGFLTERSARLQYEPRRAPSRDNRQAPEEE
jgi:N-methylhydantoinase B